MTTNDANMIELTPKMCQYIIQNSGVELLVVDDDTQLKKFVGLNIDPVKLIVYYSDGYRHKKIV